MTAVEPDDGINLLYLDTSYTLRVLFRDDTMAATFELEDETARWFFDPTVSPMNWDDAMLNAYRLFVLNPYQEL